LTGCTQVQVDGDAARGKGLWPKLCAFAACISIHPVKTERGAFSFQGNEYNDAYPERDWDNDEKLAAFLNRRVKELDGFVLFDKTTRCEIVLPNGAGCKQKGINETLGHIRYRA
jgi:hypothetical protein